MKNNIDQPIKFTLKFNNKKFWKLVNEALNKSVTISMEESK